MGYSSEDITVLAGLEPVRRRPGMYIGDTDSAGLHHCFQEVLDNAIDEAMAGHASEVRVTLHEDGSLSVLDDGRGMPVDVHPEVGRPGVEVIMTRLHAGGKFEDGAYKSAGGLHGVGVSVVNALSSKCEVVISRGGQVYRQRFIDGGKPDGELEVVKEADAGRTGTRVRFWPDMTIFDEEASFDPNEVSRRVEQAAYLNPGVRMVFEHDGKESAWQVSGFSKILGMVGGSRLTADNALNAEHSTVSAVEKDGEVEVMLALRYHDSTASRVVSYANNICTPAGGTHETAFRAALLRAINQYGSNENLLKKPVKAEDIVEGLCGCISVRVPQPKFKSQTKDKLSSPEVKGPVSRITYRAIMDVFEEAPKLASAIINQALTNARSREAARAARESVRKTARKGLLTNTTLPGKLSDCQERNAERTELYIVEGDSAGGSAKQARDRRYQAILPLKGKPLNVYDSAPQQALDSDEIDNLSQALGCGVLDEFSLERLRYAKVIITADADVDGAHIMTLLMTFFHKFMPGLVESGRLFVAIPPLYRVRNGKKSVYLRDDAELEAFLAKQSRPERWSRQRFKGLGEMNPQQLWEAVMQPETRRLGRVQYPVVEQAETAPEDQAQTEALVEMLMSKRTRAPRRDYIMANSEFATVDL